MTDSRSTSPKPRPNAPRPDDQSIHPVAATGFARGADDYATGRPGYPDAIVDWLRDDVGVVSGARVVEVGAGTGLFTRSLIATGATVTAVDPVSAMLAHLSAAMPVVETIDARADAIPLRDGHADAVVSATAFHWFATPAVLAEFHRLLKPGGMLGLIWNLRDERVPWVARLTEITNRYNDGAPREREGDWRAPFDGTRFSPLIERAFAYAHRGSVEDVVIGRTLSTSFVAALDAERRAAILAEVRALIAATPALSGGGDVVFPYVTKAYRCQRRD